MESASYEALKRLSWPQEVMLTGVKLHAIGTWSRLRPSGYGTDASGPEARSNPHSEPGRDSFDLASNLSALVVALRPCSPLFRVRGKEIGCWKSPNRNLLPALSLWWRPNRVFRSIGR